jgi:ferredoxin/flavodoxin---NADP+ reductase
MPSVTDRGTASNSFQAAIVGSGPSGFYAAEALMRARPDARVDMFDRLPTPFGLVRGGVAPDHPKIKQVCLVYDKIARSPGFSFYGNVTIGKDILLSELQETYHAVIIACGATADRKLNIPGEDLAGSYSATEFVGWYNGHPDFRDHTFDFSHDAAVVIGHGNVAADVARILATKVEDLVCTDIAEHAIEALSKSRIRDIWLVGRRGPAQARFTSVELKELGKIAGCSAHVEPTDLELNAASSEELTDVSSDERRKNMDIFRGFCASQQDTARHIRFRFLETPLQLEKSAAALKLTLAKNALGGRAFEQRATVGPQRAELPCGLVFRSVGYRGLPFAGLEFDEANGTIVNRNGRCLKEGQPIAGTYVTGWIKRGPTGLIGTNRADSIETVEALVADAEQFSLAHKSGIKTLRERLTQRKVTAVDYSGWQKIDAAEKLRGQKKGKPREKFTRIDEMIEICARCGQ